VTSVRVLVWLVLLLVVAGCGGGDSAALAEPSARVTATVTATPTPTQAATPTPTQAATPTPTPTPSDTPTSYRLLVETTLVVREGPGTVFAQAGTLTAERAVTISCSTDGEAITGPDGVPTSRWDKISTPTAGYIAGAFVDTGGTDPDVPVCTNVPDPPAAPAEQPSTGSPSAGSSGSSSSGGSTGTASAEDFFRDDAITAAGHIREDIEALDERVADGDWISTERRLGMLATSYGRLYDAGTPPGLDPGQYYARVSTLQDFALQAADEMRYDPLAGSARYVVIRQETQVLFDQLTQALGTTLTLPAA